MAEIGQPFGKLFIFFYACSYVFLVICLLAAFFLGVVSLEAFGSIYLSMLTLGFTFIRRVETEKNLLVSLALGLASLIVTSVFFTFIARQWQIMGVLTVTEWPMEEAARNPLTLRLGTLAFSLGITPQLLLSLMMNIPGPVAEESCFRIGLWHLLKPVMGERYSLIAQAAAFGLFHYFAYNMSIIGCISAGVAGLLLGVIYWKTGNELAICLSHISYNWIVCLAGGI